MASKLKIIYLNLISGETGEFFSEPWYLKRLILLRSLGLNGLYQSYVIFRLGSTLIYQILRRNVFE